MHGPPVYPPNPVKEVRSAFSGVKKWIESTRARPLSPRPLHLPQTRQPHPLFETFDMNTREVCSMRRIRTNTPLQSFQTLNDDAFVEAAQALARRMIAEAGEAPALQIRRGLQLALARSGTDSEVAEFIGLYTDALVDFRAHPGLPKPSPAPPKRPPSPSSPTSSSTSTPSSPGN